MIPLCLSTAEAGRNAGHSGAAADRTRTPRQLLRKRCRPASAARSAGVSLCASRTGIRTGVVSSTRSQLILTALDRLHLVSQFDVVICGDMVTRVSPIRNLICGQRSFWGLPPAIVWSSRTLPQASVPERRRLYRAGLYWQSIRQDVSAADLTLSDFHLYRQIPLFQNLSPF